MQEHTTGKKIAFHVSFVTIAGNLLLTAFKLFAGLFAHSDAMLSDAVHSASDILSTLIVLIGVKIASKAADKDHPYGHDRFECAAAIILSGLLFVTGIVIGRKGLSTILNGQYANIQIPGRLALVAAVVSILVKEWMYWYTKAAAKKINSSSLMADAWHHRSDALSSIGALVGIAGARLGFPVLDSVASVVICLCILKVAIDIFRDAIDKTVDRSCDAETVAEMQALAASVDGVCAVDLIRSRQFGAGIYVDIEIAVDGALTLWQAHAISQCVHDEIETNFPLVKHCMVHVNPYDKNCTPS